VKSLRPFMDQIANLQRQIVDVSALWEENRHLSESNTRLERSLHEQQSATKGHRQEMADLRTRLRERAANSAQSCAAAANGCRIATTCVSSSENRAVFWSGKRLA
jgi:regulator of replication initiation timing